MPTYNAYGFEEHSLRQYAIIEGGVVEIREDDSGDFYLLRYDKNGFCTDDHYCFKENCTVGDLKNMASDDWAVPMESWKK